MTTDLLPSQDALRWMVARFATLLSRHGEVLASPMLVEPTAKFFPDTFALEPEAIHRLLKRTMSYAPLSESLDVKLGFVEPEDDGTGGGGCSSGACGPKGGKGGEDGARSGVIVDTEEGYGVVIHVADVGDPVVLTTALARGVGGLVLREAGEEITKGDPVAESELTAVACGLGLLLLNGSCVYKKGCGGLRAHHATRMSIEELSVAVALFCRIHDVRPGVVRGHLAATQSEAFAVALDWVDAHPTMVETLRTAPESLTDGLFQEEAPKGFFARLFGKKSSMPTAEDLAPRQRPVRSDAEERRLAEARALVEEALRDGAE